MAFLLNIDTAVETASICFCRDGMLLASARNEDPKEHSSWLHKTIQDVIGDTGFKLQDLQGIAVTIGPGSYTGLRVGLSAAKGLCFALGIPLIAIGTLEMMASQLTRRYQEGIVCPMIDARRMEVFTAVYNHSLEPVLNPCAMIIDKESFSELLTLHSIVFSGNGSHKMQSIVSHPNAIFADGVFTADDMMELAEKHFNEHKWADLAYIEPMYLKEFYFANNPPVKNRVD